MPAKKPNHKTNKTYSQENEQFSNAQGADQSQQENQRDTQKPLSDDPVVSCNQEKEEYKEKYLRALADYRNYEQRVLSEKAEVRIRAEMDILERLLPFLDNIKRAEVFIKDQGLQMIKKEFEKALADIGVQEVELTGKEFDPAIAEVIEVVDGYKDNIITEVILSAYAYRDKMLRFGQVKVSKKA